MVYPRCQARVAIGRVTQAPKPESSCGQSQQSLPRSARATTRLLDAPGHRTKEARLLFPRPQALLRLQSCGGPSLTLGCFVKAPSKHLRRGRSRASVASARPTSRPESIWRRQLKAWRWWCRNRFFFKKIVGGQDLAGCQSLLTLRLSNPSPKPREVEQVCPEHTASAWLWTPASGSPHSERHWGGLQQDPVSWGHLGQAATQHASHQPEECRL